MGTGSKASAQIKSQAEGILNNIGNGNMRGSVKLHIMDENNNEVGFHDLYPGVDGGEIVANKTLNTAKVILSRMLAGDTNFKLAKIGFGNAGHNFLNKKVKVDVLETDTELRSLTHIRDSLQLAADRHYIYEDVNTNLHRMSYIEKDISAGNITFGENGDQFIVRVPIAYEDFNARVGAATSDTTIFEDTVSNFDYVEVDNTLTKHRNIDADGNIIDTGTASEVIRIDDAGTIRYKFKNGLVDGVIDTVNHGEKPQEVSEIMLCTDILGSGTVEDPYQKLASSITTSGLLELPEGFSFVYEWSLTWSFA